MQADVPQPSGAAELAERLINLTATGHGGGPEVGVSIGIALFPGDGTDSDTLMKRADIALYRAKAEGRGVFRFFEPEMDLQLQTRRALERDLHNALRTSSLQVHYQPQADTQTGLILGFEALVRWPHPERGMIPPGEFVSLAEESGLIRQLGEWVLAYRLRRGGKVANSHAACGEPVPAPDWRDLADLVAAVLHETGLEAKRLELEITEGVLIKDAENALGVLRSLKALGVAIALDDFGTGYSSLSYLQRFPFDRIKVDRSFISDLIIRPEAASICTRHPCANQEPADEQHGRRRRERAATRLPAER